MSSSELVEWDFDRPTAYGLRATPAPKKLADRPVVTGRQIRPEPGVNEPKPTTRPRIVGQNVLLWRSEPVRQRPQHDRSVT